MLLFSAKRCASGICLALAAFLLISVIPASGQKSTKKPVTAKTTDSAAVTLVKPEPPKLDDQLKGLKYREIGPFRGGRSLTASGVPGDPNVYYFGSTGGGVWKSIDGAMTWQPIFD